MPEEQIPITESSNKCDELVSNCKVSIIVFEGHEKPIQMEMYERPTEVKITSNLVLRPESYKDLLKVYEIMINNIQLGRLSNFYINSLKYTFYKSLF